MRGVLLKLLLLVRLASAATTVHQTMLGLSHSVGDVPLTSTERITYQCTFRNLWTEERQPVKYPVEHARWDGPIMWTHTKEYHSWSVGEPATLGLKKFAEVRPS